MTKQELRERIALEVNHIRTLEGYGRTETIYNLMTLFDQALIEARIDELKIMEQAAVSQTVDTFTKRHKAKRIAQLTKPERSDV